MKVFVLERFYALDQRRLGLPRTDSSIYGVFSSLEKARDYIPPKARRCRKDRGYLELHRISGHCYAISAHSVDAPRAE
jgi:hypothetical protein